MNQQSNPVSLCEASESPLLASVLPTYRRAHSAVLENGPFDALCSVLMSMAQALSDLLIPVCEYPCLIQNALPNDSPARDLAKRIAMATDRLCEINQHLIRLCRGPEGTPMDVDMGLLAQGVLADLMHQADSFPSIHASVETDGAPAILHGPHDALYHVVRDMCLNAFASLDDGGTLTIRIGTASVRAGDGAHRLGVPEQDYVCARFQDDGPGIDDCCRVTLFDPFVSTASGEGFGLGLSSVYRTVLHFGGSILYKPDGGSGADFILLFPRAAP